MTTWEDKHRMKQWGRWPETALVRFVSRKFPMRSTAYRALDVGCGAGGSAAFLASEGFVVDGIDISQTAVDRCNQIRGSMNCAFSVGDCRDLTRWPSETFDLVVDIATIQHLDFDDATKAIHEAHRVIKPGGYMFSIALSGATSKQVLEEMPCRRTSEGDIHTLYVDFDLILIDTEVRTDGPQVIANWIVGARKAEANRSE